MNVAEVPFCTIVPGPALELKVTGKLGPENAAVKVCCRDPVTGRAMKLGEMPKVET